MNSDVSHIESLLADKPDAVRARILQAVAEAPVSKDDPLWPLFVILDSYGEYFKGEAEKASEATRQTQKLQATIETDLKKELASYFKEVRTANLKLFYDTAEKQLTGFRGALETATKDAKDALEADHTLGKTDTLKAIEKEYKKLETQAQARVAKLVKDAAEARLSPIARAVSLVVSFSLVALIFVGVAGYFTYEGYALATGQPGLLGQLFNGN